MITIAVLGALLITGEYSTGMIRSTLAAVPTRLPVLAAKAVVVSVVTVASPRSSLVLTYLVTMPLLAEHDLVPAPGRRRTWQVVGGMAYFLVAAALFALGIGTMLRSTAGAVTGALTVLLLLPGVLQFIRLDWVQNVIDYLPLPAAAAFLGGGEDSLSSAGQGLTRDDRGAGHRRVRGRAPASPVRWCSADATPDRHSSPPTGRVGAALTCHGPSRRLAVASARTLVWADSWREWRPVTPPTPGARSGRTRAPKTPDDADKGLALPRPALPAERS